VTTIRFFAAARAAVGVDELTFDAGSLGGVDVSLGAVDASLGALLDAVGARPDLADAARWATVRERSTYLVDGVRTDDPRASLAGVTQVDVMPPFAGG
jgi:sulfur-carrier protein